MRCRVDAGGVKQGGRGRIYQSVHARNEKVAFFNGLLVRDIRYQAVARLQVSPARLMRKV